MRETNGKPERLTKDILASYKAHDEIQRVGQTFLPSRSRIIEPLGEIRQLLFPGYFGHRELTDENVRYHVGNVLVHAGANLAEHISYCLCAGRDCPTCDDPEACRKEAGDIAGGLLARIPKIRDMPALDAQAAFDGAPERAERSMG